MKPKRILPRNSNFIFMTALSGLCRIFCAHVFVTGVLAICALYAALQLTPSSYAIVLTAIGVENTGTIRPARAIRSDEWAVWTPTIQIAVNNGFERINKTSPYGE